MSTATWRAFEGNTVTHSVAHHLMAIAQLRAESGYARVTDVARLLGITRGSVSLTLKALREKGWVIQDDNRFLLLSESGESLVKAIRAKHAIIARFFAEVLGLHADQAAADACKIEHLLSHDAAVKMLQFLRNAASQSPQMGPRMGAPHTADDEHAFGLNCDESDTGSCPICGNSCFAKALQPEAHLDDVHHAEPYSISAAPALGRKVRSPEGQTPPEAD